jgi:hypothetical protein
MLNWCGASFISHPVRGLEEIPEQTKPEGLRNLHFFKGLAHAGHPLVALHVELLARVLEGGSVHGGYRRAISWRIALSRFFTQLL